MCTYSAPAFKSRKTKKLNDSRVTQRHTMWSMEETDIQIKLFETAELDMGPLAHEGISNRKKADRII